ncbi:MAG: hypothetical protein HYY78_21600 [Betaproteobacteria bacterium]|nr:hypothetical protein [Betaproteobacteria bacterium]
MDVLVEVEDEDLIRLLLLAKSHELSLEEEMRGILIRAAEAEKRLKRKEK